MDEGEEKRKKFATLGQSDHVGSSDAESAAGRPERSPVELMEGAIYRGTADRDDDEPSAP